MSTIVSATNYPSLFTCPKCPAEGNSTLDVIKKNFRCQICKTRYSSKNNILEFIKTKELDKETKRELKGNSFPLTKKNIEHYATKDEWSDYYNHFVDQKFNYLMSLLNNIRIKGLISLGSGPGFELKEILKRKKISIVFSSDLAFAATSVVPVALKGNKIKLCLFTSDLNYVPIIPHSAYPILIYEALHHTGNIHLSIENIMRKRFKNIFFVEPSTNFVIKILAKFGLAQREEYSGLKPDFVDIGVLKRLARKYNYELHIRTIWEVPEEYIRKICRKDSFLENTLLKIIDFISRTGNIFQFGSFAIVSLNLKNK